MVGSFLLMDIERVATIQRYILGAERRIQNHEINKGKIEVEIVELECSIMELRDQGLDTLHDEVLLKLKYFQLNNVQREIDHIRESINTFQ